MSSTSTKLTWAQANPEKARKASREWKRRNRDRHIAYKMKVRYGLTPAEHDAMMKAQDGKCAICGEPPADGQKLYVDHNHETGKVRALLCVRCNTMIGMSRERAELLQRAIDYLTRYR